MPMRRRRPGTADEHWMQIRREALVRAARRILRDDHEARTSCRTRWRGCGSDAQISCPTPRGLSGQGGRDECPQARRVAGDISRLAKRPRRPTMNALTRRSQRWTRRPGGGPVRPAADQQAVIRMKYYAGLTFREIADVLAVSQNTAASRCRYGLAALRHALGRRPEGR